MKKLFLLIIATFFLSSAFAQETNLPNGGFERWNHLGTAPNDYDQPADGFFGTLNELADLPAIAGGPGPVTVFKTTDAYSGAYAAKLVSALFVLTPVNVFIPGMIGPSHLDMTRGTIYLGSPCPGCRPIGLKGYYKFAPVLGDSCSAVVLVTKYNTTLHKRDTIGFGKRVIRDAAEGYAPIDFTVSYAYQASAETPDTMTLLIVSSAGFNVNSLYTSVGQVGTTMTVDELSLSYPLGITEPVIAEIAVKSYPNPASSVISLESDKVVKDGEFQIFNGQAVQVTKISQSGKTTRLDVSELANGLYFYRLMSGKKIMTSGSFSVQK